MLMESLGLNALPPEQRIALALELWESLGDPPASPLTPELRGELLRRDAEMDAESSLGSTWAEVRSRIEARR